METFSDYHLAKTFPGDFLGSRLLLSIPASPSSFLGSTSPSFLASLLLEDSSPSSSPSPESEGQLGSESISKHPLFTNLYLILVRWPMPRFRSTRWRPCRKQFWTWTRFPEYRSELRTPRLWLPHLKNIITIDKLSSGRPKNTTLLEMPSADRGASHTE